MIDTKFGMHYSMPHSVLHIVDNSGYTGPLPEIVADDPSLYAAIVLTGSPMGEDNKVVSINNAAVLGAFGMANITSSDRKKYGQAIAYPYTLLSQGAPVRLMRVTPADATYAYSCIVVQWRLEEVAPGQIAKLHVRFKNKTLADANGDIQLSKFANTEKLHAALVRAFNSGSGTVTEDGYAWYQRTFMTNISAGRGSAYNCYTNAINTVSQSKKPANVKYEFVTIDTRTAGTAELFTASLVNIDNTSTAPITPVNTVVNRRVEGSSIMIPRVNESAVVDVYKAYYDHFTDVITGTTPVDEYTLQVYKTLNVNTFDILYGRYLYNGTDSATDLPYYQVDMYDMDIEKLPPSNRLTVNDSGFDEQNPVIVYNTIRPYMYGITRDGDNCYIGSCFLNTTNGSNPMITIVGAINQYTGAVTALTIPKVFPLVLQSQDPEETTWVFDTANPKAIKTIFNDTSSTTGAGSGILNNMVTNGKLVVNDVVAGTTANNGFVLFSVAAVDATAVAGDKYTLHAYTDAQVKLALDWSSHASGATGCGNVIGRSTSDPAFTRVGATAINTEDGAVYVNDYGFTYSSEASFATGRIAIDTTDCLNKIGACPTVVNIVSNIVGTKYDVEVTEDPQVGGDNDDPAVIEIHRYIISGVQGSLFRVAEDPVEIPANYYTDEYGINMTSEAGGVKAQSGYTGFFDDNTMNSVEFKWRYSALLVKGFRGQLDPRIMSPSRVAAKYMFDFGSNTIVGQTILPYVTYTPSDIINASTIFTEDEKEEVLFDPSTIENITSFEDIDVKQAMYDLMVYRCFQGIPEDLRPIGPGSGLSLHLDSGVTSADTALQVNNSFVNRFNNPNASWDIGGWVDTDGESHTFTEQIVNNLIKHCKTNTVNKPYAGKFTAIAKDLYQSYFPDIDTTDWDMRNTLYNSGGNAWIADINGNLTRRSQRTLKQDSSTSDLLQENNMRTLSQLCYLLQNKIDDTLLEYNDDGVLKTLSDEVNNMFSNWVGTMVDGLEITFARDTNTDGGDLLVCYCNVTFRGLILRVPIIVNVNRRES